MCCCVLPLCYELGYKVGQGEVPDVEEHSLPENSNLSDFIPITPVRCLVEFRSPGSRCGAHGSGRNHERSSPHPDAANKEAACPSLFLGPSRCGGENSVEDFSANATRLHKPKSAFKERWICFCSHRILWCPFHSVY